MTDIQPSHFETSKGTGRIRIVTEKELTFLLKIKLANRHTAYKKLKEQMQKILALRDSTETEIEQLE